MIGPVRSQLELSSLASKLFLLRGHRPLSLCCRPTGISIFIHMERTSYIAAARSFVNVNIPTVMSLVSITHQAKIRAFLRGKEGTLGFRGASLSYSISSLSRSEVNGI